MYLDDFLDGIVAWLVTNTKAVVPLTAHAGGRLGMVGATRAAVYPISTSMVDSVTGLRYAECSRAPHYITNGYGCPMQTTSCTWP